MESGGPMSRTSRTVMIAATAVSVLTAGVVAAANADVIGLREPRLSVAKWSISCGPADETGSSLSPCTGALDARASSQGVTMTLGTTSHGGGGFYACFRGLPTNRSSAMVDSGVIYDLRPTAQALAGFGCPADTEVAVYGGTGYDTIDGPYTLWIMSDRVQ